MRLRQNAFLGADVHVEAGADLGRNVVVGQYSYADARRAGDWTEFGVHVGCEARLLSRDRVTQQLHARSVAENARAGKDPDSSYAKVYEAAAWNPQTGRAEAQNASTFLILLNRGFYVLVMLSTVSLLVVIDLTMLQKVVARGGFVWYFLWGLFAAPFALLAGFACVAVKWLVGARTRLLPNVDGRGAPGTKLTPESYPTSSHRSTCKEIAEELQLMVHGWGMSGLGGTPFYVGWLRAMGMTVAGGSKASSRSSSSRAKPVRWYGIPPSEPEMVACAGGVVVDEFAYFDTHTVLNRRFNFGRVSVGEGAVLEAEAAVLLDCKLERDARMAPRAAAPRGVVVAAGTVCEGNPGMEGERPVGGAAF